jgi:hypothetical protein
VLASEYSPEPDRMAGAGIGMRANAEARFEGRGGRGAWTASDDSASSAGSRDELSVSLKVVSAAIVLISRELTGCAQVHRDQRHIGEMRPEINHVRGGSFAKAERARRGYFCARVWRQRPEEHRYAYRRSDGEPRSSLQ